MQKWELSSYWTNSFKGRLILAIIIKKLCHCHEYSITFYSEEKTHNLHHLQDNVTFASHHFTSKAILQAQRTIEISMVIVKMYLLTEGRCNIVYILLPLHVVPFCPRSPRSTSGRYLISHLRPDRFTVIGCRPLGAYPWSCAVLLLGDGDVCRVCESKIWTDTGGDHSSSRPACFGPRAAVPLRVGTNCPPFSLSATF